MQNNNNEENHSLADLDINLQEIQYITVILVTDHPTLMYLDEKFFVEKKNKKRIHPIVT